MKNIKLFEEYNESLLESTSKNFHNFYIAKHDIKYGKRKVIPKGTIMSAAGGGMFTSTDDKYSIGYENGKVNGVVQSNYDIRKDKINYDEVEQPIWEMVIDLGDELENWARDKSEYEEAAKSGDIDKLKTIIAGKVRLVEKIKKMISKK